MKPGAYRDVGRAEYEALDAANYSVLKHYARSPAHARARMLEPPAQTPAMLLGELCHAAILEPGHFEERYVVAPHCDRRTTVGKATWAEFKARFPNHQIIDGNDYETATRMRDTVWAQPLAKELLGSAGASEVTLVWTDPETEEFCKGRIDRIGRLADETHIIDLKTCPDGRPMAFARDMLKFSYHVQAAFYQDGARSIDGRERRYTWIVVENAPPYAVSILTPNADVLNLGEKLYREWLATHKECKAANHWPGYDVAAQVVELPAWARG